MQPTEPTGLPDDTRKKVRASRSASGKRLDAHAAPQPLDGSTPHALSDEVQQLKAQLRASIAQYERVIAELHVGRDEVQALNSELTAVNEELKEKAEELSRSNSALQDLTASARSGTILLDSTLRIKRFTPHATQIFNLTPQDLNRPLADITHKLEYSGLTDDAQRVLEESTVIERRVSALNGHRFLTRLLPHRGTDHRVDGVSLTFLDTTSREANEDILRASEERYRALFDSIDEAFVIVEIIFDAHGNALDQRLLEANPAYEKLTGLKNPVGKTIRELIPDIEEFWLEATGKVALTGQPMRFENRVASLDMWFDNYVFRIDDPDSRHVAAIFTNTTERRRAEEMLRRVADDNRFRVTLTDALRALTDPTEIQLVAARVLGEHLRIERVAYGEIAPDGIATAYAGYAKGIGHLTGNICLDVFEPDLLEHLLAGQTFMETNVPANIAPEYRTAYEGLSIAAHVTVPLVKEERFVAVLAVHHSTPRDWTNEEVALIEETTERLWAAIERARAEERLRESEERFRLLVEGTKDYALFLMDTERRIVHWNNGAERIFGYTREEAIGEMGDLIFTPEDRENGVPAKEANTAVKKGRAADVRWHQRRDGTRFWADGVMACLSDDAGTLRGFVKIARDATKEKEAAEELRRAHDELEARVAERTAQLERTNRELQAEARQRRQAETAREQLLKRIVITQEEERRRISRELHDQLGQQLTALLMRLKTLPAMLETSPETPLADHLIPLQDMTTDLMEQVHRLAWNLRPAVLDNLGLEAALRQHTQDWSRHSGIETDFISRGFEQNKRLPPPVETTIYRVVQEALTNVQRHSKAQRVSVLLEWIGNQVFVIVEDDGQGFEVTSAGGKKTKANRKPLEVAPGKIAERLGLLGMRERMDLIGGTLSIESVAGRGTSLYARAPVERRQSGRISADRSTSEATTGIETSENETKKPRRK